MSTTEITVPCVAAHLLAAGVLRFLPTDADTECETCGGRGYDRTKAGATSAAGCPHCRLGRRPFRVGDRIAIRADNDLLHPAILVDHLGGYLYDGADGIDYPLRPGEVVGYATVTNVLPIVSGGVDGVSLHQRRAACIVASAHHGVFACAEGQVEGPYDNISDHIDAGLVFTPGQIALELAAGDDR